MSSRQPNGEDFEGVIGRTVAESQPWWPDRRAAAGAPNVVLIVLDDTGFAHLGCYGSNIDTPNVDRLAAHGLRFTGFHTTALCSPTRACLLTGRNPHAVGMRAVSNMDSGFPNMRGALPRAAGTLPEILRDNGYATYAAGKWHLAPMSECTAAGPFQNWPLQRGFDRYYGFLQGETDQFHPELTQDNHFVDPPSFRSGEYHVSEDIVDKSIGFIRDSVSVLPDRPFLLYLAFGATHSPHQAPQAYLDKYRGRFDVGWDVLRESWFKRQLETGVVPQGTELAPLNPGVRPWTELTNNERRFAARLQEAFAAMLDHTDAQIGRLVQFLEEMGIADNTVLLVMSDNGASQEGGASGILDEMRWFNGMTEEVDAAVERLDDIGGPHSHSNIPWGWAQAGNTPLKWYKQNTHGGGVRDPLIVHWPARLGTPGGLRHGFCHVVDITPTLLELLGIAPPDAVAGVAQMPMHGVSMAATWLDAAAVTARSTQYFEMLGDRGIWHDGWKAVTHHRRGTAFDADRWELYNLARDFSECTDLAAQEPQRLQEMIQLWWQQAERFGVLPLDDRPAAQLFASSRRPGSPTARRQFVYYPPISHIVADACPSAARGWTMSVDLVHPGAPAQRDGALINRGSLNSGFALYVVNGRLTFDYNCFHDHTRVVAPTPLIAGVHRVAVHVTRGEGQRAAVVLSVNDTVIATATIPVLLRMLSSTGMDLGRALSPVNDEYAAPFPYTGLIKRVVFELPAPRAGDGAADATAQARAAMTRQ